MGPCFSIAIKMGVAYGVRKRYRIDTYMQVRILLRELVVVFCKPRVRFSEIFFAGHVPVLSWSSKTSEGIITEREVL